MQGVAIFLKYWKLYKTRPVKSALPYILAAAPRGASNILNRPPTEEVFMSLTDKSATSVARLFLLTPHD